MTLKNTDKTNAVFTIKNNQTFKGDKELIEIVTEGNFYKKNDTFFLMYKEYTDLGTVSVLIKAADDAVSVKRSGVCRSKMEYRENSCQEILYTMPFGETIMNLETMKVKNSLNLSGGSIELEYKLTINQQDYYNDIVINLSVTDRHS